MPLQPFRTIHTTHQRFIGDVIPFVDFTYLPLEEISVISQTTFSNAFHEWKVLHFDSHSTEVCSLGSNWQITSYGSGDGLATIRRRAITWSKADLVHRRLYKRTQGRWVKSSLSWTGFRNKFVNPVFPVVTTIILLMTMILFYHGSINYFHATLHSKANDGYWKQNQSSMLMVQVYRYIRCEYCAG